MAAKKSGLGRGLDALFPEKKNQEKMQKTEVKKDNKKDIKETVSLGDNKENISNDPVEKKEIKPSNDNVLVANPVDIENQVTMVKISMVEPNRNQPRKYFGEDSLYEMAESIKKQGVLQPLLVSNKKDYYEIIAGERRWRAAKIAGKKEIPVIIKELSEQEIVEISLIENIQREDLNAIEEAMAYKRLMDEFHLKQDEIAEKVSKSRTAVTNAMRLLKLDEKVQQMLIDEMISAGHARALISINDPDIQIEVANKIFDEKLSVRETEKLVKNLLEPPKKKEVVKNTAEDAVYESLEERMKGIIGTKVFIHRKKNNKGKIEIEYYSRDELERIIDLFESIR